MTGLLVCTALGIEARAIEHGMPPDTDDVRVTSVGMGPRRARAAGAMLPDRGALAVAGFGGALDDGLRPGDVLVATEVRYHGRTITCPSAHLLAGELTRAGLTVHTGPLTTTDHIITGHHRHRLAATGARAADMETGPLAEAAGTRPFAAVRVIVDTPTHPLLRPATLRHGAHARATLRKIGPILHRWAQATGPRTVLLAAPRSFCAGVERAIEIVERALDRHGPPVHVRKQIVHNTHVVRDLERRGAVFVDELDEVPPGSIVVFSAHGVSPAVREQAARRDLTVIDGTCPLVAKVHAEARRHAARGDTVALIGHAGHEEVEGTLGELPQDAAVLIERPEDVAGLPDDRPVAYLTQTTLAVDEAGELATAIKNRFPDAQGPPGDDICYATTNRQQAVRAIAHDADLVLVIGSANSSNSRRLAEVAERAGTRALLVDDASGVGLETLAGARTVGVSAGASAPPALVEDVVANLRGIGQVTVEERRVTQENVHFTLPKEVRS